MNILGYEDSNIDDFVSLEDILALKSNFSTPFEAILFLCISQTTNSFFNQDFFSTPSEKMLAKSYANSLNQFFIKYKELEPDANKASHFLPLFWNQIMDNSHPTIIEKALFLKEFVHKISPTNKHADEICFFVEDLILGRAILMAHDEATKSIFTGFSWDELDDFSEKEKLYCLDEMDQIQYVLEEFSNKPATFKKLPETKQQLMDTFSHPAAAMWFMNLKDDLGYETSKQKQFDHHPIHTQKAFYYLINQFLFNSIELINGIKTKSADDLIESTMDIAPKINRLFYLTFFREFDAILDHPVFFHAYRFMDLKNEFEEFYCEIAEELGLDFDFLEDLVSNHYVGVPHHEILNPFQNISWDDFFAYEDILGNTIPDDEPQVQSNVLPFKRKNGI